MAKQDYCCKYFFFSDTTFFLLNNKSTGNHWFKLAACGLLTIMSLFSGSFFDTFFFGLITCYLLSSQCSAYLLFNHSTQSFLYVKLSINFSSKQFQKSLIKNVTLEKSDQNTLRMVFHLSNGKQWRPIKQFTSSTFAAHQIKAVKELQRLLSLKSAVSPVTEAPKDEVGDQHVIHQNEADEHAPPQHTEQSSDIPNRDELNTVERCSLTENNKRKEPIIKLVFIIAAMLITYVIMK